MPILLLLPLPLPGHAQLAAAPFMRESKLEDFETETLNFGCGERCSLTEEGSWAHCCRLSHYTWAFWGSRGELHFGFCNSSTEDIKKNHYPSPSFGFGPLSFHNSEVIAVLQWTSSKNVDD